MTAKKKGGYLDALDDPTLDPGRRLALLLLSYVRDVRIISNDVSAFADFEQEASRLKETLECVNCSKEINVEGSGIYCSEYCQQMAGTVRYVRRGIALKREGNIEFQIGLGDRLNHLPDGGYPARDRFLSKGVRDAIFERDNHICRICGVKPAKQIDHISGSSSDPSNLQAVCADCNRKKAFANMRPATAEEREVIGQVYLDLALRIAAPLPSKACDDQDHWQKAWPKIGAVRRKAMNEIKAETEDCDEDDWEDVDGYVAHTMGKDD